MLRSYFDSPSHERQLHGFRLHGQRATWHGRVAKRLCALTLTMMLLMANTEALLARQTPTRYDRRPDRETRIRYPQTRSTTTRSGRTITLHSAPPTRQTTSTATTSSTSRNSTITESASSTSPAAD